MTNGQRLKIGLLLDTFEIPAWVEHMLSLVVQSNCATIDLVVLNKTQIPPAKTIAKRFLDNRHRLLYTLYDKLDRALNPVNPDAFSECNLSKLLNNIEVKEVTPRQTKYCDYINDDEVDDIRNYKLDVLIRLGFRILKGEILHAAKFGVWSYLHGDNRKVRGSPPGFWEVIERQPVTGTILQVLSEKLDDGMVLSRSFSTTNTLSATRNRNAFYWKSASLLPRELQSLHNLGEEQYFSEKQAQENDLTFYTKQLYTEPGNLEITTKLPGYCTHYISKRITQKFTYEHWFLLFKLEHNNEFATSFRQFTALESPRDRYWADPCVLHESGRYYVFIEEFMLGTEKGHISVFDIDGEGKAGKPQKIIDTPYHLSYPFLFKWKDTYYLIPESSGNNTIEMYRCIDFPYRWEFHKILMNNVTAVDTTLFEHNGKWWLFTNILEHIGASQHDELFLFYADTPLSNSWTAHPENPVVSDVRKARPAGRLFLFNNAIYRPSQDCSIEYGHGINLNKILEMTETRYREQTVQHMTADWDKKVTGVHTLSNDQKLTIIDAKKLKLKISV